MKTIGQFIQNNHVDLRAYLHYLFTLSGTRQTK